MITPKKHVKLNESILGLSGIVLSKISRNIEIDDLYSILKKDTRVPSFVDYDIFLLSVNFLHMLNLIDTNDKGGLFKCD